MEAKYLYPRVAPATVFVIEADPAQSHTFRGSRWVRCVFDDDIKCDTEDAKKVLAKLPAIGCYSGIDNLNPPCAPNPPAGYNRMADYWRNDNNETNYWITDEIANQLSEMGLTVYTPLPEPDALRPWERD